MNELRRLRRSEEYGVHSDEASGSDAQCLPALWHGMQSASGWVACIYGDVIFSLGESREGISFSKRMPSSALRGKRKIINNELPSAGSRNK